MLLRNGKMVCTEQNWGNLTTHNLSYVYYWYTSKGEYNPNTNIRLIIRCVCDLLFMSFTIQYKIYYGKKARVRFEADYSLCRDLRDNEYKHTQTHIVHIEHLVKLFVSSSHFRGEHARLCHKDVFVVIVAIAFYYFQMVVIETLYDDCLVWSTIEEIFSDENYCTGYIREDNKEMIALSRDLYDTLWKEFAFSDDPTCTAIRQYVLKIDYV